MNERIQELKNRQESMQKWSLLLIALLAVSFGSTLINYTIGIVGFIIAMVLYIGVLSRKRKAYKDDMKKYILEESFKKHIRNVSYKDGKELSKQAVADDHFIPVEDVQGLVLKDTIEGTYQNCPVTVTEVSTNFHSVKSGKNGEKEFVDFMAGAYFEITLAEDSGKQLMIWHKNAMASKTRKQLFADWKESEALKEAGQDTFVGKLSKNYVYLVKEEGQALDEKLLNAFHYLAEFTPGQPALYLDHDKLRIFVRNRFLYTIAVPVRTEISAKLLSYLDFSELTYLLRIADTQMK